MNRPLSLLPGRSAVLVAGLCLAGLLSGCAQSRGAGGGAPVEYHDGAAHERPLPPGGVYTAQRGDTIYNVARQFNVSVRALIDANNLQPPYQLAVGQTLILSTANGYVVQKGDTLLGIARRFGLPFSTLARMNGLNAPYVVKLGQRLKLPVAGGDTSQVAAAVPPLPPSLPPAAPSPVISEALPPPPPPPPPSPLSLAPPADHRATDPVSPPPPPPPPPPVAELPAAQAAVVPPPPPPPPPPPVAEPPTVQAAAMPPVPPPAPPVQTEGEPQKAPPVPPAAPPATAAAVAVVPPPPAKSGRGFVWPVRGPVIAEYGTTGKGQHNDGINIAVPRGTAVVAAEDGVVAYAGNELRGFGNLLLVKHADGWMTAYAHNDALLVHRGEMVKRGQQIAKVGDSGGVSQPQLHFEVRRGTHAVDPTGFFKDRPGPTVVPVDQPGSG